MLSRGPIELYFKFMHQFYAKLIIDMTPCGAVFAEAALRSRIGYLGLAYKTTHVEVMEERLLKIIEEGMRTAGSPLFNQNYNALFDKGTIAGLAKSVGATEEKQGEEGNERGPGRGGGRGRGRGGRGGRGG